MPAAEMNMAGGIWAVVPVKDTALAKQRLAAAVPAQLRQALMLAMLEDVLASPPESVPLRFGENSFFPHLAAAEACGISPTVLHLPGIALDIDNPADLAHFAQLGSRTRAGLWLAEKMPTLASAGIARQPV